MKSRPETIVAIALLAMLLVIVLGLVAGTDWSRLQ